MGAGKRSSERALQKVLGQGANVNADNPLEVHDPKVGSLISYEGTTTADGAGDGSSLEDSVLTTKPDYNGNLVIITSGAYAGQGSDINGATTGGTVTAHTAFGGQILRGTKFVIVALRLTPAEVAALQADVGDASTATLGSLFGILGDPATAISSLIGTALDAGDLSTLFARHKREDLACHAHILLVVHDITDLDADLDTALRGWMEDLGYSVTIADPADVVGNLDVDAFDFIVVSGSCVVGDVGNLANLREAESPILCHSAAIAVSAVFNLGATAGSEAVQTQIEIIDNTPAWLIGQATVDLTVTASAAIQTMGSEAANAIIIAEEATATGDDLTIVKLPQGEEDGGVPSYAAYFDRYFNGVADYTNANAAWKVLMAKFLHHMLHEKRFEPGVVQVKRVYQEQIPDTDFSLAAIDNGLTANPPSADAENSVVDIDQKVNRAFVLRSLWVNITSFGDAGTKLTFKLWVMLNTVVTEVDSVDVAATGIQNLVDIFGLQEVHADGIWITVETDSAAANAACSGTYRYAEAKK
ncbi:hypothetical protein ES703_30696 [subsurface metagenome]